MASSDSDSGSGSKPGTSSDTRSAPAPADAAPTPAVISDADSDAEEQRSRLAYHDTFFLDSDDGRPLRILAEYLEPLHRFRREGIQDTIVFFGSARIQETGPLARYYHEARELARRVTEWSKSLSGCCQYVVCTGGGPGLMEAANRGAAEAGGRSIGLNIGLPHEQRPNPHVTPGLSLEFHYFFMRKLWFSHLARALVVFPGGFGTMDELFEMLTLTQTRKIERDIPIFLYGPAFWKEVVNFSALAAHGLIAPEDLELFQFVDDPDSAMKLLQARLPTEPEPNRPAFAHSRTTGQAIAEQRTSGT
jgi:uncharacterized protein (TIGR00730 family)